MLWYTCNFDSHRMRKYHLGILTLLAFSIAFFVLFSTSCLADDAFIVTFESDKVTSGNSSTAKIEALDDNIIIVSASYRETHSRFNGLAGRGESGYNLVIDPDTNTTTFKPYQGVKGWIEIKYKNEKGQTMVYKSSEIEITDGVNVYYEAPENLKYMDEDGEFTVKYKVDCGAWKKLTVKPFWWIFTLDDSSFFEYEDDIIITDDYEFSVTFTPTEQTDHFVFGMTIFEEGYNIVFHDNWQGGIPIIHDPELWEPATYSWDYENSNVSAVRYYNKRNVSNGGFTYDCRFEETTKTTSETVPATETKDGKIIYKARFTSDLFTTQTKEVSIPALGHSLSRVDRIEPTHTETGTEVYWECITCGKLFSDEDGITEIEKPVEIPRIEIQTGWLEENEKWYYIQESGELYNSGWLEINGIWYYFRSNGEMATGWLQDGTVWYYFDNSGAMVTGTKTIDGIEYSFDANGIWQENAATIQNGWVQDGGTWYYYTESGTKAIGWLQDSNTWYYFNGSGAMATGWLQDGSTWYYFKSSGAMATGWLQDGATWYYFDTSGAMVTGTKIIDGTEYTFDASGAWVDNTVSLQTGWVQDGGYWYYYDESGTVVTGWKSISGTWYYFKNSGVMATGWFEDKKAENRLPADQWKALWYWFDNNGQMATGWKEINGQWEMFDSSGVWLYTWDGN